MTSGRREVEFTILSFLNGLNKAVMVGALALACITAARPSAAQQSLSSLQDDLPYVVPRIRTPITFDGRVDEAAWESIEPLPSVVHVPTFRAPPTERTEFRIAYDSDYVYFSCRAYDSDPEGIRAFSLERDETGFRSDFCSIYFDTLDDEENALQFKTSPAGNRSDSQRMNDGARSDNSWNAFWDAAVSRDERGWYAELRIPFSSLLFQSRDGRVVMGVSILRNISRKNERHVYPAISPEVGRNAYQRASLMQKIVFEGIESRGTPTYITPYALGGSGYSLALNTTGTEYERETEKVREGGFDARIGVTSNLTVDVTANTDFAQVEADDEQVNLTRFSLFFPEKRRFFQERSANFEFGLGQDDRLFHSRTIGLEEGRPVRIYGGVRVVGRVGEWDVGLLDLQTAESALAPSENLGVARLRRRVLNANSYVGGIFTSRQGSGGHRNLVYGLDGIFRIAAEDYLVLNWGQSFDDEERLAEAGSINPLDRGAVRMNWERRGQDGLTYDFDLARTGEWFDPEMGFLRRNNYTTGRADLGYGWRSDPGGRLYTYTLGLTGAALRRNGDGAFETMELEPNAVLETWGLHQFTFSVPFRYENLESPFPLLGRSVVPKGIHRFASMRFRYSSPQGDQFRSNATFEAGAFFDGRRTSLSVGPIWDPSSHLNLGMNYSLDRIDFFDRSQTIIAHLAGVRAHVMLSTSTSALGFFQYSSADKGVTVNIRLRYNPREGNDFYLVWNEGLATDRHSVYPIRQRSEERTLVFKYSHTFQFGI